MAAALAQRPYQGDSIQLVNTENELVIEQLTRADLERLRRAVEPSDLADKLALFIAYLDGKRMARLRRWGDA